MPREILSLNVGQAGVQIGKSMWNLLREEHGLNEKGELVENFEGNLLDTSFHESQEGRFVGRTVFIDSEESVINDCIIGGNLRNLFTQEFLVTGNDPAGNVFPFGQNSVAKSIHDKVSTAIRRSVEQCGNLTSFMNVSSLGGGTGSGYTCRILQYLRDIAPKTTTWAHQVICSDQVQNNILEPYNNVFGFVEHKNNADVIFCYDNQTLYRLVEEAYGTNAGLISYQEANHLIALANTSLTCSARFQEKKCVASVGLSSMATNLIPFPSIKIVSSSILPLNAQKSKLNSNVYQLTAESFLHNHEMCSPSKATLSEGKYIACCLFYRGDASCDQISSAAYHIRNSFNSPFVKYVPTGLKVAWCSQRMKHGDYKDVFTHPKTSLLKVTNHTILGEMQMNVLQKFTAMYDRKDFVHWYCSEGMEEGQFVDAQEQLENGIKTTRNTVADDTQDE